MSISTELKDLAGKLREFEDDHVGTLAKVLDVVEEVQTALHEAENTAPHILASIDHVVIVVYGELSRLVGLVREPNAPTTPGMIPVDEPPAPQGVVTPDETADLKVVPTEIVTEDAKPAVEEAQADQPAQEEPAPAETVPADEPAPPAPAEQP